MPTKNLYLKDGEMSFKNLENRILKEWIKKGLINDFFDVQTFFTWMMNEEGILRTLLHDQANISFQVITRHDFPDIFVNGEISVLKLHFEFLAEDYIDRGISKENAPACIVSVFSQTDTIQDIPVVSLVHDEHPKRELLAVMKSKQEEHAILDLLIRLFNDMAKDGQPILNYLNDNDKNTLINYLKRR